MLKKFACSAFLCCLSLTVTATEPPSDIHARAAYVMDGDTGAEIYAKNADEKMYPGGTTMIMTALLCAEAGDAVLDRHVTHAPEVNTLEADAAVLGLSADKPVTLRNAVTAMMTYSGCDAALDAAVTVAPTVSAFVDCMNEKAAVIGTVSTKFVNPHGLPDKNHYSTARDLAKISAYAMQNGTFKSFTGKTFFTMPYATGGEKTVYTLNEFLRSDYKGANGIKTGATDYGGADLVASATRDGKTIIAVGLNSDDRAGDATRLMDYAFAQKQESVMHKSAAPDDGEAYIVRDAPAGQTLRDLVREQQAAVQ